MPNNTFRISNNNNHSSPLSNNTHTHTCSQFRLISFQHFFSKSSAVNTCVGCRYRKSRMEWIETCKSMYVLAKRNLSTWLRIHKAYTYNTQPFIYLFMHVHENVLVRLLNEIKANRVCCTKINFICINWRQCFQEVATSCIYLIRTRYFLFQLDVGEMMHIMTCYLSISFSTETFSIHEFHSIPFSQYCLYLEKSYSSWRL